jgi:hypothetical protein
MNAALGAVVGAEGHRIILALGVDAGWEAEDEGDGGVRAGGSRCLGNLNVESDYAAM